ncbi:MAG: hypothetical protein HY735_13310 [Verrucomicrobia bacterium]|nr:hypothetical protein [Verrucomicrobiota bacterium]
MIAALGAMVGACLPGQTKHASGSLKLECRVCGAALLSPGVTNVDADSLNSPEKVFHHYGIHAHIEAYLVCVYSVEKKRETNLDTIQIKATVIDRIKGKKKIGERVAFLRCFDYQLGDVSYMNGALYYVIFRRFENGEVAVDSQDPIAMANYEPELEAVAERHKEICATKEAL